MKITSSILAITLVLGSAGLAFARSDNHPADGAIDAYHAHNLPNGERSPAPADRANGGVGALEVPFDNAQTRTGGPVGGNVTQNGGG
jgi:hypothetical protein